MNKMCLALCLAIFASANAEPQSVFDCANELSTVMNVPNSDQQRCAALVTYSKCLSQFDADKGAEELLFKQNSKICEPYWKKLDTPTLQVRDDTLSITVDDAKDVKFYRHRREEISVFDLNEQVGTLIQEVKDLKEANDAITQAAQDQQAAVTQSLADTIKALEDQLKETSDALESALDEKSKAIDRTVTDLKSEVDTSVAATDKQLADAKKATDKQLADSKTATDKQLADAKKESKSNMDALEKKIGESVDTKLKPSSKVLASLANTYHSNPKIPVFRIAKFHTYHNSYGWLDGNRDSGYGGIHPSQWSNGEYRVDQMNNDFKYLQRLFTRKATASSFGATICADMNNQYSSTNGGHCGVIFRIKNTGKSTVSWSPLVTMTSYHGWDETASISVNGNNQIGARNCQYECRNSDTLRIPANSAGNRVSTVIYMSGSSHNSGQTSRALMLSFQDNSLNLPNNLEFVDDLDVQTGAWKK